jgi:hypothetical protein
MVFVVAVLVVGCTGAASVASVVMGSWLFGLGFAGMAIFSFVLAGFYLLSLVKVTAAFDPERRTLEADGVELAYDHIGEVRLDASEHKDAEGGKFLMYSLVVTRKDAVERGKALGAECKAELEAWSAAASSDDPVPNELRDKMLLAATAYIGGSYTLAMSRNRSRSIEVTEAVGKMLDVTPRYDDKVDRR